MEKKKYIVLLLQIAAVAAAGVIGGDTLFALVTALIGITFNFMVSMNFAPGFLFGFVYAVCNGILAWQTKVYATFVFMTINEQIQNIAQKKDTLCRRMYN